MDAKTILAERLHRQRLIDPLKNTNDYKELFRLLQPVAPVFFSSPGDPPRLVHRTAFDDGVITDNMREERVIVKGRFWGGNIGYVLAEDLEIYANAYSRPIPIFNEIQLKLMEAIERSETLTPRQMKEETGLLIKHVMPNLHRLQTAFLVYEDQINSDWERNWYIFESEWSNVEIKEEKRENSSAQIIARFLENHVFATIEQLKDWSQFSSKLLKNVIGNMEKDGTIIPRSIKGLGDGWILSQDSNLNPSEIPTSVFMLHKSDILVKSHVSELKKRFGANEVLQYLLIDGEFKGAVLGHWRIGPHDVDNIIVELPIEEREKRRKEIIDAVAWGYHPPYSHILKYNDEEVS